MCVCVCVHVCVCVSVCVCLCMAFSQMRGLVETNHDLPALFFFFKYRSVHTHQFHFFRQRISPQCLSG